MFVFLKKGIVDFYFVFVFCFSIIVEDVEESFATVAL